MSIRIASIDIGAINFAQYIEDVNANEMLALEARYKSLPKNKQRRVRGAMSPELQSILDETALMGTRIQTGVYNFKENDAIALLACANEETHDALSTNMTWSVNGRKRLLCHLRSYDEIWKTCDVFVIEQQFFNLPTFVKGKAKRGAASGANVDAIKIAESVFMWLLDKYPNKEIMYFGSQFKTLIFGAPAQLDKKGRKAWTVQRTKELYTDRNDKDMINIFKLIVDVKGKRINTPEKIQLYKNKYAYETIDASELADKIILNKQKADDYSDAFMQCQAFKFRKMVACF